MRKKNLTRCNVMVYVMTKVLDREEREQKGEK